MAIYYQLICWSVGYNYAFSLAENALLIQCHNSECGMKNGFQPLQEFATATSQDTPRNPARLWGSQLISQISSLGYRPTHTSDGNSGQCHLGGNMLPRPHCFAAGDSPRMPGLQHVGVEELAEPMPMLAKLYELSFQYWCSCAFFGLLRWKSCLVTQVNYKRRLEVFDF